MPRVKAGELSLTEIRNLVRQHNKLTTIKGVDTKTRANLLKEIDEKGYRVDHEKKKIIRKKMSSIERKKQTISVGQTGERKPQKKTVRKRLIQQGDKPVMADKTLKERKAKEKQQKLDQLKRGYPNIPKNVKGKQNKY
jgi:hypothetical protein